MSSPADTLAAVQRSDPARPRVTQYDDTDGPARGERVELSARVLANWVSKAANALQDEWDAGPGSLVRVALPPHWRGVYWALAAWSVGACVCLDDAPADVVVSDDPGLLAGADGDAVLVTLPALARAAALPVPAGAMDEARELATYGDQFSAWVDPGPADPALRTGSGVTAYGSVLGVLAPAGALPADTRLHTSTADPAVFLGQVLRAWSADGSVVLSRGAAPDSPGLEDRLRAEGVTLRG